MTPQGLGFPGRRPLALRLQNRWAYGAIYRSSAERTAALLAG
jgi:hypothetical protein